jgi:hypothetical protein
MLADRAPMNAQFGTDLAQRPALGVEIGRTLNVHGGHGNGSSPAMHSELDAFADDRCPDHPCSRLTAGAKYLVVTAAEIQKIK